MKPRRWFRFSIREMLLLVLIAGLILGWGADHLRERTTHKQLVDLAYRHAPLEEQYYAKIIPTLSGQEMIRWLTDAGIPSDVIESFVTPWRNEQLLYELWKQRDKFQLLLQENKTNDTEIVMLNGKRTTIGQEVTKILDKDFDPNIMPGFE